MSKILIIPYLRLKKARIKNECQLKITLCLETLK